MLIRRFVLIALSIGGATLSASPAVANADGAGTSTSVSGISAWREQGASNLGAMSARPLTVTFALRPRNQSGLQALDSHPHAALAPAQFDSRFAPSLSAVNAIRAWATAHRLSIQSVSPNRLLVRIGGSSISIARALNTGFDSFSSSLRTRSPALAPSATPVPTAVLWGT